MGVTSTSTKAPASASNAFKQPIQGKPVSGRVWKKVQTTRFSTMKYHGTKTLSSSWDQKLAQRAKLKELKELQQEIKNRRKSERDAKKLAKEEREKRRKENELKSAAVQVISKTHKLKSMSKKQLRNIRKTIVNKQGVVEYVPVYPTKSK